MNQSNNNEERALVKYSIGDEEIKLTPKIVQEYLTNGQAINLAEFKMFSELCKARKLNPFLKEAYIIKYGNSTATIVVGKDAILKRAINHKAYSGREQGIIIQKQDGTIEERKGAFYLEDEKIVGGWAKVYRKGWEHPTFITVALNEAAQTKRDGSFNQQWATKTATMIEKVALVRALRETFVEDLGGMIDEDEAWKQEDMTQRNQTQEAIEQVDALADEAVEELDINEI